MDLSSSRSPNSSRFSSWRGGTKHLYQSLNGAMIRRSPGNVNVTVAAIAAFLLLSNIYLLASGTRSFSPSNSYISDDHTAWSWSSSAPERESIYLNRRRAPRSVDGPAVRELQTHAFDQVEPSILLKPDLEALVGRSLPIADQTSLDDLLYGKHDEIPDSSRDKRVIYFVTPTYRRDTQMVDLTRMSQTLQAAAYSQMGIVYWIIIEDADAPTRRVRALLERSGLPYAHISARSDPKATGRGMAQRNAGIKVARDVNVDGVVYFADDDNAYDVQLVTELTRTKSVAIFGVGLVGNGTYERCHVSEDTGRVDSLLSGFNFYRKWGVDMAGFAFSTAWNRHKNWAAGFDEHAEQFTLEPNFLERLIDDPTEFQPLSANCTRMLVWHTRTHIHFAGYWEMSSDPEWKYISATV